MKSFLLSRSVCAKEAKCADGRKEAIGQVSSREQPLRSFQITFRLDND